MLGCIATAVAYFERGGWINDAQAFRQFSSNVFDTDKVEDSFEIQYELEDYLDDEDDYCNALTMLKYAGAKLFLQHKQFGEDNWTLFMKEIEELEYRQKRRRNELGRVVE